MNDFAITLLPKLGWTTAALSLTSLALDYLAKTLNAKSYRLMAISGFAPLTVGVIVLFGSWQVTIRPDGSNNSLSALANVLAPNAQPYRPNNRQLPAGELERKSDSLERESKVDESTGMTEEMQTKSIPISVIAGAILVSIWLAGLVWKMGASLASYTRLIVLSRTEFSVAEEYIQAEWVSLLGQNRPCRVPVYESSSLGPALCLLPTGYSLVVPRSSWSKALKSDRELVMRHELSHYKRSHIPCIAVCRVLAAIHWFNPFARACAARFELACEWQADDDAVGSSDVAAVQLAKSLVYFNNPHASILGFSGAAELASNDSQLKRRVSRLFSSQFEKEAGMYKISLVTFSLLAILSLTTAKIKVIAAGSSPIDDSKVSADSEATIDPTNKQATNNEEGNDAAPPTPTQDAPLKNSERSKNNPYLVLFDQLASRSNSPMSSKELLQKAFRKDFRQLSNQSVIQFESLKSIVRSENGDKVTYEFDVDPFLFFQEFVYLWIGDRDAADRILEGIQEDPQGPRIDMRKVLQKELKREAKLVCRFVNESSCDWQFEIGLVDQESFQEQFRQYCKHAISIDEGLVPQTTDFSHVVFQTPTTGKPLEENNKLFSFGTKPRALAVRKQRIYFGNAELVDEAIKP